MAIIRTYIKEDSTLYSEYPLSNTGLDEIIEIANYTGESSIKEVVRAIVKYDEEEIISAIEDYNIEDYTIYLKLYLAEANELPRNFNLELFPVSENWEEGIGKFGDTPLNKTGVTWVNRTNGNTNPWTITSYPQNTTGSFNNVNSGGGSWFYAQSGSTLPVTYNIRTRKDLDCKVDITTIAQLHISGTIQNNGIILKLEQQVEDQIERNLRLKFFGSDTNTVYAPSIDIVWDDSSYSTGSLSVVNSNDLVVSFSNLKETYTTEEKTRFRMVARPKYPLRTFTTSSIYLTNYALPVTSYWSVVDEDTKEVIVPYDSVGTKVSCDNTGPYFDVFMNMFQPERYYRILLKTVTTGNINVVNNSSSIFKVVRNE